MKRIQVLRMRSLVIMKNQGFEKRTFAGTIITHTQGNYRDTMTTGGINRQYDITTQALITVNGSQAIDVRFKTGSGTFSIDERSFILVKDSN